MLRRASTDGLLAALVALLVAALLFVAVAQAALTPVESGVTLPISTVQALAAGGRIQSAVLHTADHRVTGTYAPASSGAPVPFWSEYPPGDAEAPALLQRLATGGATVKIDPQPAKATLGLVTGYVMPVLLTADVALLLLLGAVRIRALRRGAGNRGALAHVTFADVGAADAAVRRLLDVAQALRDWRQDGVGRVHGVLLHGPPGCGKTLLARALAGEAGAALHPLRESLAAALTPPAVVLAENIDLLSNDERTRLLRLFDADVVPGVVIAGTAELLDRVEPSLRRGGRFDVVVGVEPPDPDGRRAILQLHALRHAVDRDVDIDDAVRRTTGLAGADLAAIVSDAARNATRARRTSISALDLDDALIHVQQSESCRGHVLSADERRRAAVHEAGHAVVAAALGRGRLVQRVSVLAHSTGLEPRPALSGTASDVRSRSDLLAELTVLCAGVAAEELYFDEPSTIGEPDLRQATELAMAVAGRYGMSWQLGRLHMTETTLGEPAPAALLGGAALDALHQEVRRLVDDATSAATGRLQRCHDPFVDLVLVLERDEVVEGLPLNDILIRALEVEIAGMTVPIGEAAAAAQAAAPVRPRRGSRR